MSEATRVTRTVDTDLDVDELWSLVADGDGWASWMVDGADVDGRPGAGGTVVDDGVARDGAHRRLDDTPIGLAFTWWPRTGPTSCRPSSSSCCRRRTAAGCTSPRPTLVGRAPSARYAWDVRLMLLVAQALAVYV